MELSIYVFSVLLWFWFLGCIVTYKIGRIYLVEGMGVKSYEFVMLTLFTVGFVMYILYESIGKWVLISILCFWIIIQFFCHWYYTIFGASDSKILGYNQCFENTIHLFPKSTSRIIPDFYHIILHLLIIIEIILIIISINTY